MRVLFEDKEDNSLIAFKVKAVRCANSFEIVHSDNYVIKNVDFSALYNITVLEFETYDEELESVYVVVNSFAEANNIIKNLFENGMMNLTKYKQTTFINPDEDDVNDIDELYNILSKSNYRE